MGERGPRLQILSYPIGLLIGLFPIAVDLGESRAPAHLLLDGRPVCEVSERSPGCMVDLGPDPRVHRLELLRSDAAGRVTERVSRWINRPGQDPEVLVAGGCDETRGTCEFDLAWAHPRKLDPKRLSLQLDGVARFERVAHHASVTFAKKAPPQVVACDVEFPDGTRATYSRTLYSFYPEQAQASLSAVPIVPDESAGTSEAIAGRLNAAGFPVRAVEETEPEVTFVIAPDAFDAIQGVRPEAPKQLGSFRLLMHSPLEGATDLGPVHVLFPDSALPMRDVRADQLGTLRPEVDSPFSRYADAVAAAGYALGGSPRRRAVVLVLSGFDRPNISSFTAAQARAYLDEVMVPLVVWRVGGVVAPEWPDGLRMTTKAEVLASLRALRAELDRQRIAWIEGSRDTRYLGRWLTPGIALAGRVSAAGNVAFEAPEKADGVAAVSVGPDGGPVHALALAGDGAIAYAGTHDGVFRARGAAGTWERISTGLPIAPVRSLAVDSGAPGTVAAGTDAGLFLTGDGGEHWRRGSGELSATPIASLALDPSNPRILYAGTAGRGVLRSDDGGQTLLQTAMNHGDFRALVVNGSDRSVLAASETGVFRSRDRGITWSPLGKPPSRIVALAIDASAGRIFAATDGDGLLVSADSGTSWAKTGLVGSSLTSIVIGSGGSKRLVAGSPDGVSVSEDAGATWKLSRLGPAEAVAFGADGSLLAATVRGVLRRAAAGSWRDASSGLAAQLVYSVARSGGSPSALYAATSTGLMRSGTGGSGWSAVPGLPDGVAAYSVVPSGPSDPDVFVGTSGSIGRSSDDGQSWSFSPTLAAFHIAVNPAQTGAALAATREGVLKSEDGGAHWKLAVSGLEKTFALQLGEDLAHPQTVYAATAGGGVFRTGNGARSWKPAGVELTRRIVRCVVVEPGDGASLLAGTDSGVFRSADRGESWAPASEGLPPATVYALAADPAAPGTVFAGTARGLYRSTDRGAHWSAFPAAGVRAAITALWIDEPGAALVAGSLGAGVFVIPLGPLH